MSHPPLKIFISYRRADHADFVERIRDWFVVRYQRDHVFMDFDTIPPFVRFADFIRQKIHEADVVVAIIGPRWLEILQERLAHDEEDFVPIELALALQAHKLVAPICIQDAPMPRRQDLPPDLQPLTDVNAVWLESGRQFLDNIERVMDALEQALRWREDTPRQERTPHPEDVHRPKPRVGQATQRLLDAIKDGALSATDRAAAAGGLAKTGDPRPGIGVWEDGVPDIDWVAIPSGEFIYQEGEKLVLPRFYIARYPVTRVQFQAFIDDPAGYRAVEWWEGLVRPLYPPAISPGPENEPVTGVTWYEALAFCRWLTARLEYSDAVTLPTEFQWEKAARGIDGRRFPWGNDYHAGYANLNEPSSSVLIALNRLAAVGIFPQSISPYGVHDLLGNVMEWCLDDNTGESLRRVVRGASWLTPADEASAVRRLMRDGAQAQQDTGFRVCVQPKSLESTEED